MKRIELFLEAYETSVLPLNYIAKNYILYYVNLKNYLNIKIQTV